jgi:hypothetical protein
VIALILFHVFILDCMLSNSLCMACFFFGIDYNVWALSVCG